MIYPHNAHTDLEHAKHWLSELTASLPTQKSTYSTLFIGFLPSKLKRSFEITHILESGARVTETAQLRWYGFKRGFITILSVQYNTQYAQTVLTGRRAFKAFVKRYRF